MEKIERAEGVDAGRRRLIGATAIGLAVAQLGAAGSASATVQHAAQADFVFGPVKQVRAGLLDIGYVDVGPAHGPAVVLLHGWPYDIHSFADVAPLLAARGHRVIVPFLRGHGTTRFLASDTMRNGQPSVFALDVIALMDALHIQQAVIGGFDWGTRTANIVAALWPQRCKGLIAVSGYSVGVPTAAPLPPELEHQWWYQFYFTTEQGRAGYDRNRHDFAKLIWKLASPAWTFDDATFDRSAAAFDNPDHVDITIHNYRWRQGLVRGEATYDALEARLAPGPAIDVPTIVLEGNANGAPHQLDDTHYRNKFTGRYAFRLLPGIGHNLPQEAPQAFAQAVVDVVTV